VTCSFDPNDKRVFPPGHGDIHGVDIATEQLTYTIRFQNTGNAPAQSVMLRDRLDPWLDPATLIPLTWSHDPTHITMEADGELVVRFNGINLPDSASDFIGSQGFFTFAVSIRPDPLSGTEIHNTAEIYFDLNEPVITNTTLTTLVDCSTWTASVMANDWNALIASSGDAYQWAFNGMPIPGATEQVLFFGANGAYTCAVTSPLGCVAISDAFMVTTAGVRELDDLRTAVVPNPWTGAARVVFSEHLQQDDRIELVDAVGRVLQSWTGNGRKELSLQQGELRAGLYLVRVLRDGRLFSTARAVLSE
jgi:hypothetical protein